MLNIMLIIGSYLGHFRNITLGFLFFSLYPFVAFAEGHNTAFNDAVQAVRDKNYGAAYQVFLKLAEESDHDAQYNLALLLRKGLGHPTNYAQSLKWVWLAQIGGNAKAPKLCEELLQLVPEDTKENIRLQVKQVLDTRFSQGEPEVVLQLAQYHLNIVDEPEYKEAYALRALAAAIGIETALKLRDDIEDELEPGDLIEAQALASKLFKERSWGVEVSD